MKIKFTLDQQDVKQAIAAWVTQQSGIGCSPDHVHAGGYSWDTPYVEIDTDVENELTSLAAE